MNKIAVLIPSYRPGDYLINCFNALDSQTLDKSRYRIYIGLNGDHLPYESLILDYLSKMSFDYEYVYIESPGVSNARNVLIDISKEEFIVFIDDDDLVSPNYLEELLAVSSVDTIGITNICNFETDLNHLKQNYIGKSFYNITNTEESKLKSRKHFSSPCAKMIDRNMIGNHRFDPNVAKGEDSLFMALISKNVKAVKKTSPEACYYVYERVDSATRKKTRLYVEVKTLSYLMTQYFKLLLKPGYDTSFILTRILATGVKFFKLGNRLK